ncbi:hypothetical protein QQ045_019429 [Rhodiola kirilowii]
MIGMVERNEKRDRWMVGAVEPADLVDCRMFWLKKKPSMGFWGVLYGEALNMTTASIIKEEGFGMKQEVSCCYDFGA